MDYQSLHMKTVVELKKLAKDMKVRVPAGTNKSVLIEMLLEADRTSAPARTSAPDQTSAPARTSVQAPAPAPAQEAPASVSGKPDDAPKASESAPEKPDETPKPAAESAGNGEKGASRRRGRPARAQNRPASEKAAPEGEAQSPEASERPAQQERRAAAAPVRPSPAPRAGMENGHRPTPRGNANPRGSAAPHGGTTPHGGAALRGAVRPASGENRPAQPGAVRAPRFVPRQDGQSVRPVAPAPRRAPAEAAPDAPAPRPQEPQESGSARGRREGYYNAEYRTSNPAVPELLAAGDCADGAGVLELQQDGYGFLRAENCLPGPNDVYISIAQIRRFNLRMGDYVVGKTRPQREGDRYSAMLYITSVNGAPPEEAANRPRFEDLIPIYPEERLRLEATPPAGRGDFSLRLIDMLAPIGKGQRGMIVSQPKAGKTTLLKKVANAITANYPEVELIVLLIDERPEEVTDMKRSIEGEVIYSTFDEEPEHHVRVTEMVLERAQRLVEMGKDVVVLMDSITRLARAYNLVITPTGRSLSGGLDPGALFKPKRFFGAARNIENGGSLTVIATALVETGSRMDDIIFEEFKGTGNMELHLDRKLSDKRVFPAIDMVRSGTRREELLLTEAELDGEMLVRRVLSGGRGQEMAEQIIALMSKTSTNAEFFEKMKGWIGVFEKEGYTLGGSK